jgi:hypothetical protein
MIAFSEFEKALPRHEFLTKYGSASDRDNWDQQQSRVTLSDAQLALLKEFKRTTPILVLAGAWCGDCAFNCSLLEKIAQSAPSLQIRYLDRDDRADLQAELTINGGNRVPVAVFYSEDGFEVARFGEKTLSEYRRKVRGIVSEHVLPPPGDRIADALGDWLDVIERVQWILRSSPRIRRLHGD